MNQYLGKKIKMVNDVNPHETVTFLNSMSYNTTVISQRMPLRPLINFVGTKKYIKKGTILSFINTPPHYYHAKPLNQISAPLSDPLYMPSLVTQDDPSSLIHVLPPPIPETNSLAAVVSQAEPAMILAPPPPENINATTRLILNSKSLLTIDVNKYINIKNLYCYNNFLVTIDLTSNSQLFLLHLNNNCLKELNTEFNPLLTTLICHNNLLTSLDLAKNTKINCIYCYNNLIKQADADKIAYDLLQHPEIKKGQLAIINQLNNQKIEITAHLLLLKNAGWLIR